MTLQLVDRSHICPHGIVENLLVNVGDKLVFPADFVICDINENEEVLIILGRLFLRMGRALIDVLKGEVTLRVNEIEVTFNVCSALKHKNDDKCYEIETFENLTNREIGNMLTNYPIVTALNFDDDYLSDE